ncbi:MAG TPA: cupin domain-containing protein [Burkholderiales bacterium]|nr:cupin domain-containing protein [Burkholderiales bacterium]
MNLASTFVVLHPDPSATPVELTPSLYDELERRYDGFRGHVLVSCFSFDADWPVWERHPAGDEIVCLLSGRVRLVLEGAAAPVELKDAGAFIIVPKGTWHTAKTSMPTTMLFVTPGAGTEHKPVG